MLLQTPITSITEAIGKPVIVQILEKLNRALFLDAKIPMHYIDHTGTNTVIGGNLGEDNDLRLKAGSSVNATAIENYDESKILTSLRDTNARPPVWYDEEVGASIRPNMISNKVVITLTYSSKGRQEALGWGSNYYNRLGRGNSSLDFDVEYDYPVSNNILAVINQMWLAKGKKIPTTDTFIDYLEEHITQPFTYKTNMLGKGTTLAFKNKLTHLVGVLSETVPTVTKTDTGYESSIEFTVQYDLPTTFVVEYPAMVHNSYINSNFIDLEINRNEFIKTTSIYSDDLLREVTELDDSKQEALSTGSGIVVPSWDSTELSSSNLDLARLLHVQLMVSLDDRRNIINLATLEDDIGLELHPELLLYIVDCGESVFDYKRSAVHLGVHVNGDIVSGSRYYIDGSMVVRSDYDLHIEKRYHFSISLLRNLCLLPEPSVAILAKYGSLAHSMILCLDINFPMDKLPPIREDGSVSSGALKRVFHSVKTSKCRPSTGDWFTVNTIMTTT